MFTQTHPCELRCTPALRCVLPCFLSVALFIPGFATAAVPDSTPFEKEIQPLLRQYCYDCHGDGASKGKVSFDNYKSTDELLAKHDLWQAVLKNTRAGLMP